MPQPERYQELRKKLRRRKPRKEVSLGDALLYQGAAVVAAWEELMLMQEIGNSPGAISAIHALNQATASLAKLKEITDHEKRIAELERLQQERHGNLRRAA